MADRGGPTEQDRSEGMPSHSEAPNDRGKSPWLLGALPSDPPSGRNHQWSLPQEWICTRSTKSRSAVRPPSRAGSLPHLNRVHPRKSGRLVGRLRWQASSYTEPGTAAKIRSATRPPSLASQLLQGIGGIYQIRSAVRPPRFLGQQNQKQPRGALPADLATRMYPRPRTCPPAPSPQAVACANR
ncbi:hypothetical protein CES87_24165 [Pseudomonas sp. ERMR1:02]|nr:hypothetical protein CES87_24165 [Pseudomonas sp. ERMR1:02]